MTYLGLIDIIEFNKVMTNKFSKEQLEEFIRLIAADNETAYNNAVELFYIDTMEFDYEDVEDLINNIKSGNPTAIKRFIEDIDNYCKEELKDEDEVPFWSYIHSLKEKTDKWRYVMDLGTQYHKDGKDPNKYIDEIKEKVNNEFKK